MEILVTEATKDYELIDSGDGEKLERYGQVFLRRPDPQAIFPKSLKESEWQKADFVYERKCTTGRWFKQDGEAVDRKDNWKISHYGSVFNLLLMPSKHLGLFPEQGERWGWLEEKIERDTNMRIHANNTNKIKVLNLFAYTGGATMACARAGAEVVHVDSSEFVVGLARKNLEDSGLGEKSVRFIVDDVSKFVEREIKRGKTYDIITLDPPIYGKGEKGRVWKIEKDLPVLLSRLTKILSTTPKVIVLNGYASVYSSLTYAELLKSATKNLKGKVVSGEMAIKDKNGKLLPCGIFARWENKK